MNRLFKAVLIGVLGVMMAGCGQSSSSASYGKINAEAAKAKMDQESVVIVDVRTKEEYVEGHIPNAINVPLDEIESIKDQVKPEETVLVYCRSGSRSAQAAQKLSDMKYEHIFDFGGINDWPYDIVK